MNKYDRDDEGSRAVGIWFEVVSKKGTRRR